MPLRINDEASNFYAETTEGHPSLAMLMEQWTRAVWPQQALTWTLPRDSKQRETGR